MTIRESTSIRICACILAIWVAPKHLAGQSHQVGHRNLRQSEVAAIRLAAEAKLFGKPVLMRRDPSRRGVFIFEPELKLGKGNTKDFKKSWRFIVTVVGTKQSHRIVNPASLHHWANLNDSRACAAVAYAAKLLNHQGSLSIPAVIGIDATVPGSFGISFIRTPRGLGGAVLVVIKKDLSSYRIIHS